jgi:glycosyltransferase involved in cell wall biosynthesis
MMPENQKTFFSVIITVFNQKDCIERAILSVLNQSFKDYELIIINDCSTDNTIDIINKYSIQDNIIIINHLKNESVHISRMDGVIAANGRYIIFLDGDDYFTENAFSVLYNKMKKNPGYDFYEFGYIRLPSGLKVFPAFSGNSRFSSFFDKEKFIMPTVWNKVYNSILLKKAFTSMDRAYVNIVEDIYQSIVISYFLRNTIYIKKIIINYQDEIGLSTEYKNYNKTIELLQYIKTMISLVELFIKKNNLNISLDNLYFESLSSIIINRIYSQKNKEDMKDLFLILPEYFDIRIIIDYLLNREESYRKITKITNFKYYKVFKRIIKQLRKIKNLFKLNK